MFRPRKRKNKTGNNFAFIDSQNLNLGTQKAGWKMDWRKFRHFLQDKYNVSKAYMFIGYMPENEDLYKQMHEAGYLVVLKPTQDLSKHHDEQLDKDKPDEKRPIKGNIDADLVLWAMKELNSYSQAIIVSGDGDFHGLLEYLVSRNKLKNILTPNWQYSHLLKEFDKYIERLDRHRSELQYRNHYSNKR